MRVLLLGTTAYACGDADSLRSAGMEVEQVETGQQALVVAQAQPLHLALFEVEPAGVDGCEVLRRMRDNGCDLPVILASVLSEPDAKVRAFSAGADDYLTRPIDRSELIARVHAIVRRSARATKRSLHAGPVTVDLDGRLVTVNGRRVYLSHTEYEILALLMCRMGTTLTKAAILDHVYAGIDEPTIKIIDVFVCKARRKLADAGADNIIATSWGRGYYIPVELRRTPAQGKNSAEELLHALTG